METVMRNTYAGFLSESEIDALLEGKDYWFDAQEFATRFEQRNEYLEEKGAELQKAFADLIAQVQEAKPEAPKRIRKPKAKPAAATE
jgi:YHS domain-containing protein